MLLSVGVARLEGRKGEDGLDNRYHVTATNLSDIIRLYMEQVRTCFQDLQGPSDLDRIPAPARYPTHPSRRSRIGGCAQFAEEEIFSS